MEVNQEDSVMNGHETKDKEINDQFENKKKKKNKKRKNKNGNG